MSTLKNAPLSEVIFELRWNIINQADLGKIQYLYGDLYSVIREEYPFRETVVSGDIPMGILINQPVHRYRSKQGGYPLVQVGPGILTLNVDDENYFSRSFIDKSQRLLDVLIANYSFDSSDKLLPSLVYLDFYIFDFQSTNAYEFIDKFFNIDYSQKFILEPTSIPTDINLGFYYTIGLGDLSVIFQKGKNLNGEEGILVQTRINGTGAKTNKEIITWLKSAHKVCKDIFMKLTEGELYNSFK